MTYKIKNKEKKFTSEENKNLRIFVSKMDEKTREGFLNGLSVKDRKKFLKEWFEMKPKKAKKKFHGAIVENTTWLGKKQIKFEGMKSV